MKRGKEGCYGGGKNEKPYGAHLREGRGRLEWLGKAAVDGTASIPAFQSLLGVLCFQTKIRHTVPATAEIGGLALGFQYALQYALQT